MQSTVAGKGQITVPKPLRDRFGIRAGDRIGDRIEFSEQHDGLILQKATTQDPVSAVYGVLSLSQSTDEAPHALRDDPDVVTIC